MVSVLIIALIFTTVGVSSDFQRPVDLQGNPITQPSNYKFDVDWLKKAQQEYSAEKAKESKNEKKPDHEKVNHNNQPISTKYESVDENITNESRLLALIGSTSMPDDTTTITTTTTTSNQPISTKYESVDENITNESRLLTLIGSTSMPDDTTTITTTTTTSNSTVNTELVTKGEEEDKNTEEPNKQSKCYSNTFCAVLAMTIFVYTTFDLFPCQAKLRQPRLKPQPPATLPSTS